MMPRMKKRVLFATVCLCAVVGVAISAQRPDNAPATQPAGKPPDTVFIEDLTWAEVRDLIASGTTNVIVGTAGTEQKGPHMVDGEHKFVMEWSADKIARLMGKTLVAPIVTYVPEGSWENIGGHMAKPGTITPHTQFQAQVYVLSKEEGGRHTPFFDGYRPQFYFRTTDVTGTANLPKGVEMVMPGDNVEMTVDLIAPIAMEEGLRFAIREGGRTVGAGRVTKILK